MNTEMYTERVEQFADEIPDDCGIWPAVPMLIQSPYSVGNGEDTFLYAVPEEYGGGTRLDPMDVLKHSPSKTFPPQAFDGNLLEAAREQLAYDIADARGEVSD